MMGSRSLTVATYSTHSIQDGDCEPEEYDLDTYALNLDTDKSAREQLQPKYKRILRNNNYSTTETLLRYPPKKKLSNFFNGHVENVRAHHGSITSNASDYSHINGKRNTTSAEFSQINGDAAEYSYKSLSKKKQPPLSIKTFNDKSLKKASKCSEKAEQYSPQGAHDDSAVYSSSGFHIPAEKGVEHCSIEQSLGSGLSDMDEMDASLGLGTGRSTRRNLHHQPTSFLKTVSIIDTLSELGPDDRHNIAEEPCRSPPTKSPCNTRRSSKIPPSEAQETNRRSNALSAAGGPPLVSFDFQEYTEKIYDAVTKRRDLLSAGGGVVIGANKYRTRNEDFKKSNRKNFNDASGLNLRRGEKNTKSKKGNFSGRERGRTPDWIKKIFDIAKKGDLESIKHGISDMEDTLVRNLSDHVGNNLLHVMAVYGHLASIAWMLTTQPILIDALHDENKYGITPLVYTIKYGRLHILEWLVDTTCIREKVRCKDGERSLLHIASKYAQEEIVAWLVDYMMSNEIPLDNKDHHGNTALHLIARSGNSRVCSILMQHGADVTLKNDLGQKAWEVCVIRGHMACAEYLCVHETGLALATDLTRREAELETAMADNNDLRLNFKEVMNISRRLIREREEAVRELSRLHEQMIETHDSIMSLHVLPKETLQENQTQKSHREEVESVITYVTNLHERWQAIQKSWFSSSLVNMKHRMLLVEEAWKKLRHKSHRTVATTHHPLDVFRGKLCEVRDQGGEGRLGDLPSLCSSEESLASLFPFSENEEDKEDSEDNYETLRTSINLPDDSNLPLENHTGLMNVHDNIEGNKGNSVNHRENMRERKLAKAAQIDNFKTVSPKVNENQARPYWTDPSLSASLSLITDLSQGQPLPREELNARLKEYALTSESGSCSVVEVIEPSSEDNEGGIEDSKSLDMSSNTRYGSEIASDSQVRPHQDRKGKRISRNKREDGNVSGRELTPFSESGADNPHAGEHSSHAMDMSSNINSEANHFLGNETSVGVAATDVSERGQRQQIDQIDGSDHSGGFGGATFKRKGFLHKLIKRKVKSIRKIDPVVSRETAPLYTTNNTRKLQSNEIDTQTTPESNTSSSHEYSNSSEESSIGKPASAPRPTESFIMPYAFKIDPENKSIISSSSNIHDIEKSNEKSQLSPLSSINVKNQSHAPPIPSRRSILSPTPSDNSSTTQGYHSDKSSLRHQKLDLPMKSSVSEVRSIATSEDSGIVARPPSSASKSECASRPESSTSNFPSYKNDYVLQKSNLCLTQDMLPTPDSSTAGRMSPAPSEVSKTESALSPPSDMSKSESSRQTSMGKGSLGSSTNSNCSKDDSGDYSALPPLKKDTDVKTAAIINISSDQKIENSSQDEIENTPTEIFQTSIKERPWYELSDEESDILLPDRLNSKVVTRDSSSDEEVEQLC